MRINDINRSCTQPIDRNGSMISHVTSLVLTRLAGRSRETLQLLIRRLLNQQLIHPIHRAHIPGRAHTGPRHLGQSTPRAEAPGAEHTHGRSAWGRAYPGPKRLRYLLLRALELGQDLVHRGEVARVHGRVKPHQRLAVRRRRRLLLLWRRKGAPTL